MIQSVHIQNFKSVVDLELELGRFNVLIGENGCGKSNILEAIAFGAAANADKLDREFLGSRGIRVTDTNYMYAAFPNSNKKNQIFLYITPINSKGIIHILESDPKNPQKWNNVLKDKILNTLLSVFQKVIEDKSIKDKITREALLNQFSIRADKTTLAPIRELLLPYKNDEDFSDFINSISTLTVNRVFTNHELSNFIVYSIEESSIRKSEDTTQIFPLGIKGEGLFQYLKEISKDTKKKKILTKIQKHLSLLDWFDGFNIPKDLMFNEFRLHVKDRYLDESLQYFDQRSANEGFLFLLFYFTLFISPDTPEFFAIDNLDSSLNPKMCRELTRQLTGLAKKNNKQAIITTHNPAILDGLDLKDDEQRLFVVRRNSKGHTIANRIPYNPKRTLKLSELWTSGIIGGLPDNF